jgi:nucleoside-diphosphate-sugar epimerase
MAVNYDNREELRFALIGVDTVISTISGQAQLNLIDAAASAGVRRFAPAEFEGSPSLRPIADPLDNGKAAALQRLRYYASGQAELSLESTVFVCGILYERFGPNGMGRHGIGHSTGVSAEGTYLMDIRNLRAQIPYVTGAGNFPYVCMTSASDVARFVVRALDLPSWPPELRMCGERLSVDEVVRTAEAMKGTRSFQESAHPLMSHRSIFFPPARRYGHTASCSSSGFSQLSRADPTPASHCNCRRSV